MQSSVAYKDDDYLDMRLLMRGSRVSIDVIQRELQEINNGRRQRNLTISGSSSYNTGGVEKIRSLIRVPHIICTASNVKHTDTKINKLTPAQLEAQLDMISEAGVEVASQIEVIREQVANIDLMPSSFDTINPVIEGLKEMVARVANTNENIQTVVDKDNFEGNTEHAALESESFETDELNLELQKPYGAELESETLDPEETVSEADLSAENVKDAELDEPILQAQEVDEPDSAEIEIERSVAVEAETSLDSDARTLDKSIWDVSEIELENRTFEVEPEVIESLEINEGSLDIDTFVVAEPDGSDLTAAEDNVSKEMTELVDLGEGTLNSDHEADTLVDNTSLDHIDVADETVDLQDNSATLSVETTETLDNEEIRAQEIIEQGDSINGLPNDKVIFDANTSEVQTDESIVSLSEKASVELGGEKIEVANDVDISATAIVEPDNSINEDVSSDDKQVQTLEESELRGADNNGDKVLSADPVDTNALLADDRASEINMHEIETAGAIAQENKAVDEAIEAEEKSSSMMASEINHPSDLNAGPDEQVISDGDATTVEPIEVNLPESSTEEKEILSDAKGKINDSSQLTTQVSEEIILDTHQGESPNKSKPIELQGSQNDFMSLDSENASKDAVAVVKEEISLNSSVLDSEISKIEGQNPDQTVESVVSENLSFISQDDAVTIKDDTAAMKSEDAILSISDTESFENVEASRPDMTAGLVSIQSQNQESGASSIQKDGLAFVGAAKDSSDLTKVDATKVSAVSNSADVVLHSSPDIVASVSRNGSDVTTESQGNTEQSGQKCDIGPMEVESIHHTNLDNVSPITSGEPSSSEIKNYVEEASAPDIAVSVVHQYGSLNEDTIQTDTVKGTTGATTSIAEPISEATYTSEAQSHAPLTNNVNSKPDYQEVSPTNTIIDTHQEVAYGSTPEAGKSSPSSGPELSFLALETTVIPSEVIAPAESFTLNEPAVETSSRDQNDVQTNITRNNNSDQSQSPVIQASAPEIQAVSNPNVAPIDNSAHSIYEAPQSTMADQSASQQAAQQTQNANNIQAVVDHQKKDSAFENNTMTVETPITDVNQMKSPEIQQQDSGCGSCASKNCGSCGVEFNDKAAADATAVGSALADEYGPAQKFEPIQTQSTPIQMHTQRENIQTSEIIYNGKQEKDLTFQDFLPQDSGCGACVSKKCGSCGLAFNDGAGKEASKIGDSLASEYKPDKESSPKGQALHL